MGFLFSEIAFQIKPLLPFPHEPAGLVQSMRLAADLVTRHELDHALHIVGTSGLGVDDLQAQPVELARIAQIKRFGSGGFVPGAQQVVFPREDVARIRAPRKTPDYEKMGLLISAKSPHL